MCAAFVLWFAVFTGVLTAQPVPFFMLDTARVIVEDAQDNYWPRFAMRDSVGLLICQTARDVVVHRIDGSLALIDTLGTVISGRLGRPRNGNPPAISRGEEGYAAVWSGETSAWDTLEVLMALLTDEGSVIRRVPLAKHRANQIVGSAVCYDGSNYVVVWSAPSEDGVCTYFSRVSESGAILDSPPRRVAPRLPGGQEFSVAAAGSRGVLAAWIQILPGSDGYQLWANVVLPDGTLLDSAGVPVSDTIAFVERPAVAFNGQDFAVIWNSSGALFAARVTPDGVVRDSVPARLADQAIAGPDMVYAGDTGMVVWLGRLGDVYICARRIDADLQPIDTFPILLTPPRQTLDDFQTPAVATGRSQFIVSWEQCFNVRSPTENMDVAARRVSTSGLILDTAIKCLSYASSGQEQCDVAANGTAFLAVWTDSRSDTAWLPMVYGTRFDASGTILDPASFKIGGRGSSKPAVAWGGGCYLVCWLTESLGVSALRVSSDGVLLDSAPIRIRVTAYGRDPDVAYAEGVFLVAWDESYVKAARVTPAGELLDSIPIELPEGMSSCRVASDGSDFLVTYRSGRLYAQRVTASGTVLDSARIPVGRRGGSAHVACGAGVYMALCDGGATACRIATDGTVLDSAIPLQLWFFRSDIAFDGENFVAVAPVSSRASAVGLLMAQRINPAGVLIDSLPFVMVVDPDSGIKGDCALAADSLGRAVVGFSAFNQSRHMAYRCHAAAFTGMPSVFDTELRDIRVPDGSTIARDTSFLRTLHAVDSRSSVRLFDATGRLHDLARPFSWNGGQTRVAQSTVRLPVGVYFLYQGDQWPPRRLVVIR